MPFDPLPDEWISDHRQEQLLSTFGSARQTLAMSGYLDNVLQYWIRQQVAAEAIDQLMISSDKISEIIHSHTADQRENFLQNRYMTSAEYDEKITIDQSVLSWCYAKWGDQIENLFLSKKSQYDQVSYSILRVSDKGLCQELYHQIRANENTLSAASAIYSEGPERNFSGVYPLDYIYKLPKGLQILLKQLLPGQLCTPRKVDHLYAIVELIELRPAVLDQSMREILLRDSFKNWSYEIRKRLSTALM